MSDELLSQSDIDALMGAAAGGGETPATGEEAENAPDQPAEVTHGPVQPPNLDQALQPEPVIQPVSFSPVTGGIGAGASNSMQLIMDVQLQVTVELGRAVMQVRDVLALGPGAVVELDTHAGEPVEVVVNNKTIARGEVVVIDENFGVRITEIVSGAERESRAKAA